MALARSTARRYAEAAFEIAQRDDSMEAWRVALDVAEGRLVDPEASRLLANPAVPAAARVEVLERILGDDVIGPARNLFALMVRRGRFEQLSAVIAEFRRLHRQQEGIVEATVTSATPLDEAELESLRVRLERSTGKRVELTHEVDAGILGGLVVRLGDQLIDGSIRGRLARLRNDLATIAT